MRRRVQFHETDAAGIVHFSRFFLFMEEAEHALWREAGLSIARGHDGIGFPRVAAACEFLRPLRFEDEFDVRIRIAAITRRSIRYVCALTRDDEPVATGSMTIVCVGTAGDTPMRAVAIPPDIAARFEVASTEPT
jgi:YbgC/YbaW family acyl-CoA thioester hydrolase